MQIIYRGKSISFLAVPVSRHSPEKGSSILYERPGCIRIIYSMTAYIREPYSLSAEKKSEQQNASKK